MKKTVAIRIEQETYEKLRKIKTKTGLPIIHIIKGLVFKAKNKDKDI
jgi:predicted DNA-binding protein